MNWNELQKSLKDKIFLIGITFINENEDVIENYQTSGKVLELTDDGMITFLRENKSDFQIPYDERAIMKAEKGDYKEKSTGKIIVNPDYISRWKIEVKDHFRIDEIKEVGFIGFKK